jgi:flagellar basal-body rod protein FlgC
MMQLPGSAPFTILGSGITADQLWMDVIAENLANANSTAGPGGTPYRQQEVLLAPGASASGASFGSSLTTALGVHVSQLVSSSSPFPLQYDPGAPGANAAGYVPTSNVNPVEQMTNLVVASQSFDANVSALSVTENTSAAALKILQGL